MVAPNNITFEIVTGTIELWFEVGCYLLPLERDRETAKKIEKCTNMPLMLGNLNTNLDLLTDKEEGILLLGMRKEGFGFTTRHFVARRTHHSRGSSL